MSADQDMVSVSVMLDPEKLDLPLTDTSLPLGVQWVPALARMYVRRDVSLTSTRYL